MHRKISTPENGQGHANRASPRELKEVVMGLHWAPPQDGAEPVDLDALCVLLDAQDRTLEVVHPDHPATANGSVLHTGDSLTGASEWDDERIFVFLDALPEAVSALSFFVVSTTGHALNGIPGAYCHVSERETEQERLRVALGDLGPQAAYRVATLRRGAGGWTLAADVQAADRGTLPELLSRAARGEQRAARP
jgi:tellurium resistance protein TerD